MMTESGPKGGIIWLGIVRLERDRPVMNLVHMFGESVFMPRCSDKRSAPELQRVLNGNINNEMPVSETDLENILEKTDKFEKFVLISDLGPISQTEVGRQILLSVCNKEKDIFRYISTPAVACLQDIPSHVTAED